eukprot:Gb_10870 [translate_table: standard]
MEEYIPNDTCVYTASVSHRCPLQKYPYRQHTVKNRC